MTLAKGRNPCHFIRLAQGLCGYKWRGGRETAEPHVTIILGLLVTLGCMLGGFMAMGGHVSVIWQPWEYVIICGAALGTFIVANPLKTIKDTGKALMEGLRNDAPTPRHYLDVLAILYSLMRELRGKSRNEVEKHIDEPDQSAIFQKFPSVLQNEDLTAFICDYCRLIIIGNVRTHEIESLMDEEIQTIRGDMMKSYHALVSISEGLPALGIVAAVLGVIKTMASIDQPPEILGKMIGGALVGTFLGVFLAYGFVGPFANRVKAVIDEDQNFYNLIREVMVAALHQHAPNICVEVGRQNAPAAMRPSYNALEEALRASKQSLAA
jgi:chemotaxis protein MotA